MGWASGVRGGPAGGRLRCAGRAGGRAASCAPRAGGAGSGLGGVCLRECVCVCGACAPQVCGEGLREGCVLCSPDRLSRAEPPKGSVDVSFEVRVPTSRPRITSPSHLHVPRPIAPSPVSV